VHELLPRARGCRPDACRRYHLILEFCPSGQGASIKSPPARDVHSLPCGLPPPTVARQYPCPQRSASTVTPVIRARCRHPPSRHPASPPLPLLCSSFIQNCDNPTVCPKPTTLLILHAARTTPQSTSCFCNPLYIARRHPAIAILYQYQHSALLSWVTNSICPGHLVSQALAGKTLVGIRLRAQLTAPAISQRPPRDTLARTAVLPL